jgi:hypothetical protein
MKRKIKIVIISVFIFFLICIISGCILKKLFFKDWGEIQKWKRIINLDLKTERNIEEYFIVEFDQEWDFPSDNDPYEGYFIDIDLDVIYTKYMDNYINIEISDENEIIFFNKINIFEPVEGKNYFTKKVSDNNIDYKLWGEFGKMELKFNKKYKIKINTFFDKNLIEINKFILIIKKRVL